MDDDATTAPANRPAPRPPLLRRLNRWLWRWHFWPGLLLSPIILTATVTGGIYIWKDEVESITLRDRAQVTPGDQRLSADELVAAALEVVPGELSTFSWSGESTAAAEIIVRDAQGESILVWVNPFTAEVTGSVPFQSLFFRQVRNLHRWLWSDRLVGDILPGKLLVELATSWTILLTVTGIILWWNGSRKRPEQWKLFQSAKPYVVWRNWHTVPAVWLSAFLILILVTGLVFSSGTGTLLRGAGALGGAFPESYVEPPTYDTDALRLSREILIERATQANADPYLIYVEYPGTEQAPMVIRGNSQVSPQTLSFAWIDPVSGEVFERGDFAALSPYAQFLTAAFSLHVGWIGGVWTKMLATVLTLLLILLVVSGIAMWWIRRPRGKSGFPKRQREDIPTWLFWINVALGLIFPTVGICILLAVGAFALSNLWQKARI